MSAHLRIIRADVHHVTGQEGNWRDALVDMGKRDVLIIFDIRRYQESLSAFAKLAAGLGVTVILFTDQWLSPIARVAKHTLSLAAPPFRRPGIPAPRCLPLLRRCWRS